MQRLHISRLTEADLPSLAAVLWDERVYRHIGEMPSSPDEVILALRIALAGPPPERAGEHWLHYGMRLASGELIGRLEATVHDGIAEVAFLLAPAYWGRGFASEGLRWLHKELAQVSPGATWWATAVPENTASARLLERSGYVRVPPGESPQLLTYEAGDLVFCRDDQPLTMLIDSTLPGGRFVVTNASRRDIQKGATFTCTFAQLWTREGNGQFSPAERAQGPDVELCLADVEVFRRHIECVPRGYSAGVKFSGSGAEALRDFLDAHPTPWIVSLASPPSTVAPAPSIGDRIAAARGGYMIVRAEDADVATPVEAARLFGLFDSADIYQTVSREEALSVLVAVLVKDMAYGVPLVPQDEATDLAETFLASVIGDEPRYYTNGTFGQPRSQPNIGPSWSPATEHTFDTGVIVLTDRQVGCAWFMDED